MIRTFDKPVDIVISRSGRIGRVTSPRDALRHLFDGGWPDRSGAPFESAVGTCLKAIAGEAPTEAAREAFISAARRAHVLAVPEGA